MTTAPSSSSSVKSDPLELIDVDHIRFYVGNAKQAAYFYANTFGFRIDQMADLTTGSRGGGLPAYRGQHSAHAHDAYDQGPSGS